MIKKSEIDSLIIAKKVSELEAKIDEILMLRYYEGCNLIIDLKTEQPKEVLEKIKEIYEKAGWKIEFKECCGTEYGTSHIKKITEIKIS